MSAFCDFSLVFMKYRVVWLYDGFRTITTADLDVGEQTLV